MIGWLLLVRAINPPEESLLCFSRPGVNAISFCSEYRKTDRSFANLVGFGAELGKLGRPWCRGSLWPATFCSPSVGGFGKSQQQHEIAGHQQVEPLPAGTEIPAGQGSEMVTPEG